ncbi:MAG: hypothetical protein ACOYOU_15675 [Kiritimatiellia bacterium]
MANKKNKTAATKRQDAQLIDATPCGELQWRQTSGAWIASVPKCDDVRGDPVKTAASPTIQALCTRLLGIDGKMVCIQFKTNPILFEVLLIGGKTCHADHVKYQKGMQNECFANSALVWSRNKNDYSIVLGFALSGHDQMWRCHAWVQTKRGTIIETTVPWKAYFGAVLPEQLSQSFLVTTGAG